MRNYDSVLATSSALRIDHHPSWPLLLILDLDGSPKAWDSVERFLLEVSFHLPLCTLTISTALRIGHHSIWVHSPISEFNRLLLAWDSGWVFLKHRMYWSSTAPGNSASFFFEVAPHRVTDFLIELKFIVICIYPSRESLQFHESVHLSRLGFGHHELIRQSPNPSHQNKFLWDRSIITYVVK